MEILILGIFKWSNNNRKKKHKRKKTKTIEFSISNEFTQPKLIYYLENVSIFLNKFQKLKISFLQFIILWRAFNHCNQ